MPGVCALGNVLSLSIDSWPPVSGVYSFRTFVGLERSSFRLYLSQGFRGTVIFFFFLLFCYAFFLGFPSLSLSLLFYE